MLINTLPPCQQDTRQCRVFPVLPSASLASLKLLRSSDDASRSQSLLIRHQQSEDDMSGSGTPEQVLKSIVDGINAGNLDALMPLYEPEAAFAAQPGNLAHGLQGSVNH